MTGRAASLSNAVVPLLLATAFLVPVAAFGLFPGAMFNSYVPLATYLSFAALLAAVAAVRWSDRPSMPWCTPVIALLCVALPAAAFASVLWFGASTRFTSFSVIQYGDANDFYETVAKLLTEGTFETPRGRPFVNAVWAGLIELSGFDIGRAMLTAAIAAGAAVFLWVGQARHLFGWAAVLFAGAVLLDYVYEFLGATSSELPGFVVGLAATGLVAGSAATGSRAALFLGFGLLCVTMTVRPGALFLLPILVLWAWRFLPLRGIRPFWTPVLLSVVFVAIFAANGAVTKHLTPTSGGGFVNAADSWYAVFAQGRERLGITPGDQVRDATLWRQIYDDHPDIEKLPRSEQSGRKLEIILNQAATYPLAGVVGALMEYQLQIAEGKLFRFIELKPMRYLVLALFLIGGIASARHAWSRPGDGLVFAAFLGSLVSIPFMFGGESRAIAGSVGLLALIAAYGGRTLVGGIAMLLRRTRAAPAHARGPGPSNAVAFTGAAAAVGVAVIALGALGIAAAGSKAGQSIAHACPAGSEADLILAARGVSIVPAETAGAQADDFPHPVLTPPQAEALMAAMQSIVSQKTRVRYRLVKTNAPLGEALIAHTLATAAPVAAVQAISLTGRNVPTYLVEGGIAAEEVGQPLALCVRRDGPMPVAVRAE